MASTAFRNEADDFVVPTYESDYAAWAHYQAMLLRAGQLHLLDRAWIAEELDSLGKQEFQRLEGALRLVLQHMLKWDCQPERRSRSWTTTIDLQRHTAERQLDENPSLKPRRDEAVAAAFFDARRHASGETDLPLKTFPEACPDSWDEIMTRPFAMEDDQ